MSIQFNVGVGGATSGITGSRASSANGASLEMIPNLAIDACAVLAKARTNLELAKRMALSIFAPEGLNQPAAGVQALQIVVAAEPKNGTYWAQLAAYAYKAKNVRVGDLASAKALALIPAADRARVKTELEAAKKSPGGEETLTGTTNGKKFTVKKSPSGSYTGALPTTTTTTPKK